MSFHDLITGSTSDTLNRSTRPSSLVRSSMVWATRRRSARAAWRARRRYPDRSRVNGRSHQILSIVAPTSSMIFGAARVRIPLGPIGQSELSMSMICLARRPCGVLVSMWMLCAAPAGRQARRRHNRKQGRRRE